MENIPSPVNAMPVKEGFGEIAENVNMPHAVAEMMQEILWLREEKENAAVSVALRLRALDTWEDEGGTGVGPLPTFPRERADSGMSKQP
jgi:hypothetical protein